MVSIFDEDGEYWLEGKDEYYDDGFDEDDDYEV